MSVVSVIAQTPELFEKRVKLHVKNSLSDTKKTQEWKIKNTTPFIKMDPTENVDMMSSYENELRTQYIQDNMQAYMDSYFGQNYASPSSNISICDNGGFEQDLLNYTGSRSSFTTGSTTCNPFFNNLPSFFTQIPIPAIREVEIVTAGLDPVTGIQRVKFGNKALKLNDLKNRSNGCTGSREINRIEKQFLVTAETRKFTVWYSVALENPTGHNNTQPFFSIRCDLAPQYDFCFDAELLQCDDLYEQPGCNPERMDVLDWACHTIVIPESQIGQMAKIEITTADCGETGHNGYAYIDGICEDCAGSSLGNIILSNNELQNNGSGINYYSCDGQTAMVCGRFDDPSICGLWELSNLNVPGYSISNISIDNTNNTFCFTFPISNFGANNCLDIFVEGVFRSNGLGTPLIVSNSITICKSDYKSYDIDVVIGDCYNNGTTDLLSDDYYYVKVEISDPNSNGWTISRKLLNPYQGESGTYQLQNGSGSSTLTLGPFSIQDGCWTLLVALANCEYTEKICPPAFCSGCDAFAGLQITNVKCNRSLVIGQSDTWSFDIYVPGTGVFTINGVTKSLGSVHTIDGGNIGQACLEFILEIESSQSKCRKSIIVCPPLPCSQLNCKIEVYPNDVICVGNSYMVNLKIKNPNNLTLCYKTVGGIGSILPGSGLVGPFTSDVQLVVYDCNNPLCFKVIYLPKLRCEGQDNIKNNLFLGRVILDNNTGSIIVSPNPSLNDELIIMSELNTTEFEIYNISSDLILANKFVGKEHRISFSFPQGLYLIRYKTNNGNYKYYKFVKL